MSSRKKRGGRGAGKPKRGKGGKGSDDGGDDKSIKDARARQKEKAAFDSQITRAELEQANAWLSKKHGEAEVALMDTLRGKPRPSSRQRQSGVVYAGKQVRSDDGLRIEGVRSAIQKRPSDPMAVDAHRVDLAEARLRKAILNTSSKHVESAKALHAYFDEIDEDGSGRLSVGEIQRALRKLGVEGSKAEMEELVEGLAVDGNLRDGIKYSDFVRIAFPKNTSGFHVDNSRRQKQPKKEDSPLTDLLEGTLRRMVQDASLSEKSLRDLFHRFDRSRTGKVSRVEFRRAFSELGIKAPSDEVQQLMDRLDQDGDGLVSYREFVMAGSSKRPKSRGNGVDIKRPHLDLASTELLTRKLKTMIRDASWNESSLRRVFRKFDKKGKGLIGQKDFKRGFEEMNIFATRKEIDGIISKLDRAGNGTVNYEEFISAAEVDEGSEDERKTRKKLRDKWRDSDSDSDGDKRKHRGHHKREKGRRDRQSSDEDEDYRDRRRGPAKGKSKRERPRDRKDRKPESERPNSRRSKSRDGSLDSDDETSRKDRTHRRKHKSRSRSRSKERKSKRHDWGSSDEEDSRRRSKKSPPVFGKVLSKLIKDALHSSFDEIEVKRIFRKFDKDKSGFISRSEFKRAFNEMGIDAPRSEIQKMIERLDKSGDGEVEYKEFINAVKVSLSDLGEGGSSVAGILGSKLRSVLKEASLTAESLKKIFDAFDKDGSGTITASEFQEIFMKDLRLPGIERRDVKKMMRKLDKDGDGNINYREFLGALDAKGTGSKSTRRLTEEMHRRLARHTMTEKQLRGMFQRVDKNKSGKLSRREFHDLMKTMGLRNFSVAEIDKMLDLMDNDGDGLVSYSEFIDEAMYASKEYGGWANISREEFQNVDIALSIAAEEEISEVADSLVMLRRENEMLKREMSKTTLKNRGLDVGEQYLNLPDRSNPMDFLNEVDHLSHSHRELQQRNSVLERQLQEICVRANVSSEDVMKSIDLSTSRGNSSTGSVNGGKKSALTGKEKARKRNKRRGRRGRRRLVSSDEDNDYSSSDDRRSRRRRRRKRSSSEESYNSEGYSSEGQYVSESDKKHAMEQVIKKNVIKNEWHVSDEWIKAVFDQADGSALVELERICRSYDVTNSGAIAPVELRLALRQALNPVAVPDRSLTNSMEALYGYGLPPGLSPSALVFGELIRRFESRRHMLSFDSMPTVDYEALLTAILNRGKVGKGNITDTASNALLGSALLKLLSKSSKHTRTDWVDLFEDMDSDGSGKISAEDFRRCFKKLRIRPKPDRRDIKDLINTLDKDGDGLVSYKEFLDALFNPSNKKSGPKFKLSKSFKRLIDDAKLSAKEFKQVFLDMDDNGTGKISPKEFKKAFKELGIKAHREDIEDLMDEMDKNGDGVVSYQEFIDVVYPTTDRRSKRRKKSRRGDYGSEEDASNYESDRRRGKKSTSRKSRSKYSSDEDSPRKSARGRKKNRRHRSKDSDSSRSRSRSRSKSPRDKKHSRARSRSRSKSPRDKKKSSSSRRKNTNNMFIDVLEDKIIRMISDASWTKQSMTRLFKKVDKDNSGTISAKEFQRIFEEELHIRVNRRDVKKLMSRIDEDNDGEVDYCEFVDAALKPRKKDGKKKPASRPSSASLKGRPASTSGSSRRKLRNLKGEDDDDVDHYSEAVDLALRKMVQRESWNRSSLQRLFRSFDKSGSGKITVGEFKRGFAEMGLKCSTRDIVELIDRLDTSGKGTIDYNEFVKAALLPVRSGSSDDRLEVLDDTLRHMIWDASFSESSLRRLFARFDRTGSGMISKRDFKYGFEKMGLQVTSQDIKDLIRRLDHNGDGLVNYSEFVDAAFLSVDGSRAGSPKKTRWGRRNPLRSISPTRRTGGGFKMGGGAKREY